MSCQPTRSMTKDDHWPKLAPGTNKIPASGSKSGPPSRSQPVCANSNETGPGAGFAKALTAGVGDQKLANGAVNNAAQAPPIRISRHSPAPSFPPPEARMATWSEVARRGTPPPMSPILSPAISITLSKANDTPVTSSTTIKRSKPSTQIATPASADNFPPLLSEPAIATKDTKSAPARKDSYATAATATSVKTRPTVNVVTTGAYAAPSVSESPVSFIAPRSTGKVFTLNIGSAKPAVPDLRSASPTSVCQSGLPRTSKHSKQRSASNNTLSPPVALGRNRSASVSSVATSIATSVVTTSSRGPPSSKTSVCHTPTNDDSEWQLKLTELAQRMSSKERATWEKILRSNPKDTSKMKWNTFDKALRALHFKSHARGGSETEYTPDPEYFGAKAQPISYHRPHPGADFTLGDLKAKSNSFRTQYSCAVEVLHEAWGLVDTRK
ncbi:unnamed protein product [Rhizoctonia solani]|uniref:Uncharacterized protein n=1 Tax=Rhizoctonia solani TaxID=456999 RepID=A0A8H3G8R9_9AGAM|nr:unnamed protein product [Rhizoctonia solani]